MILFSEFLKGGGHLSPEGASEPRLMIRCPRGGGGHLSLLHRGKTDYLHVNKNKSPVYTISGGVIQLTSRSRAFSKSIADTSVDRDVKP